MTLLAEKHCSSCHSGTPRLETSQIQLLIEQLPGWSINNERLVREWAHPDFLSALGQVNRIAEIAEAENHHPDLELAWGRVHVTIWTHAVGGLTENDFILAAKIDQTG